jgi:hypothetical protein
MGGYDQQLGVTVEYKRVGEIEYRGKPYSIFNEGVNCEDICQGQLGDCYYLSALAVLGSEQVRDKFVFVNTDDEWMQTGCFCVKFYDGAKEDIIIVDDFFPFAEGSDDFLFVSTPKQTEIWPNILEKAYAKKYGSYAAIDGGFINAALAELTNGIPDSVPMKENANPVQIWNELMAIYKEGNMMGASSNPHPDGDSAKSDMGIVQGHAYSILKLMEADGHKLVQLRNPWGQGEWKGDWSDDSELWTTRMKNLTG